MGSVRWLLITGLLISLSCTGIQAQAPGLSAGPVRIIRHTPKIRFELPRSGYMVTARWVSGTDSVSGWRKYFRYPTVSAEAIYTNYGNKPLLGEAFGLFPSIRFEMFALAGVKFGFKAGTGLAYNTRKYDRFTNPLNNVISSNINNITQFSLELEKTLGSHFTATVTGHLTHYSNARTVSPNLGVNTYGVLTGVYYKLPGVKAPVKKTNLAGVDTSFSLRRWGGDLVLGYGISEYSYEGGPKFGAYFVNAGAGYSFSPYLRAVMGLEYEYNESVFQFYYQDFIDKPTARKRATKTAIYAGTNMVFGHVMARIQSGFYLPYPAESEKTVPFNVKLGINCLLLPDRRNFCPYIGVLLKSHVETAQYMGIVAGAAL